MASSSRLQVRVWQKNDTCFLLPAGRDLWVMVVSASPYEHMIGKPDVKYVANMHGNEAVGRELMLHLIQVRYAGAAGHGDSHDSSEGTLLTLLTPLSQYLVNSYETDPYIKWLLDNTRIHILPSMNPDGFEVSREGQCDGGQGRYNARGFDLNRNFPDYFKQNNKRGQPETDAVKEWTSKIQFVLSGGLHGGALVASYPFDNTPNSMFQNYASTPSLTPDDDVFKHLAITYSSNHPVMSRGVACKAGTPAFNRGITNGAEWYPLTGGMQDFNYVWYGCMEVTLELSCCKFPPASELPKFWEENRVSLVKFLAEAHRGVHGFVMDENGNPVEKAALKVKGRDVGFQTTKYGEFWRILLPGVYKLEVYAEGYLPREVDLMVVEQHPTLLNVTLHPAKVGPVSYASPPSLPPLWPVPDFSAGEDNSSGWRFMDLKVMPLNTQILGASFVVPKSLCICNATIISTAIPLWETDLDLAQAPPTIANIVHHTPINQRPTAGFSPALHRASTTLSATFSDEETHGRKMDSAKDRDYYSIQQLLLKSVSEI
ncbi:hypothetical protein FOCC_FOCC008277 [Frankliniella occidentalis]|nr:hypothetical protein FOCC_FOCC008277 [Frankliniella occidentalis]